MQTKHAINNTQSLYLCSKTARIKPSRTAKTIDAVNCRNCLRKINNNYPKMRLPDKTRHALNNGGSAYVCSKRKSITLSQTAYFHKDISCKRCLSMMQSKTITRYVP